MNNFKTHLRVAEFLAAVLRITYQHTTSINPLRTDVSVLYKDSVRTAQ